MAEEHFGALRPRRSNIITPETSPSPLPSIQPTWPALSLSGRGRGRGRARGGVFRSDDITAPRSKCCKVVYTSMECLCLETKGLFVDVQNGFRNGRSTMESVAVLDQDIKRAFSNKEVVVSVFLDIEKAYDSLGLMVKNV